MTDDLTKKVWEGLGAYGVQASLTGELAPTTEFANLLKEMSKNSERYLALRNDPPKDLAVRRKTGWTYIYIDGDNLDRAADVLVGLRENEDGRQHPAVPTEEA
jgi:hypothetical protein